MGICCIRLLAWCALILVHQQAMPCRAQTGCESDVLTGLGVQGAYQPQGYTINLVWQPEYNLWWEFLGCLKASQQLKLSGSLPALPASWAYNTSFPHLQSLDVSQTTLQGTLPPNWGQPQAFPSLRTLNASFTQLTGPLPSAWGSASAFQKLENMSFVGSRVSGGLPDSWGTPGAWPALKAIQIDQTSVSGTLPSAWATNGSFPALINLELLETKLSGALPEAWGSPRAFPALQYMGMAVNSFTGTLPETWAAPGSFPQLSLMDLSANPIAGTIPRSWGAASAFPSLLFLYLNQTQLTGSLPSFNNSKLALLIGSNSGFEGSLDAFWSSAAPLLASLLAGNNISGSLPANTTALGSLAFLDLSDNSVQGSVPDSWLQEGGILSHIIGLNAGNAWLAAQRDVNWREDLCLQPQLYKANVQSQPLSKVNDILGDIFSTPGFQGAVGDRYAATTATFNDFYTQLSTIKAICSNRDAPRILLIMWLTFAAATSLLFVLYEGFRVRKQATQQAAGAKLAAAAGSQQANPFVRSVSKGAQVINEGFWGLAELVMYYYDLVSAIIVLTQIWGAWPGWILFAIFLFHFALTGAIVLYHGFKVYTQTWQSQPQHGMQFAWMLSASALLSPLMIPVVLLLDAIALYRELRHFCDMHVIPYCCKHRSQARSFHHGISSNARDWSLLTLLKLDWLDLEYYEAMHTLVAAFYQTVPTVVLNSIIFRLGNKPSHGEFFSNGVFISCMVAAYLSMFKTLITIVWHAFFKGPHAFVYTGQVMVGRFLIRQGSAAQNSMSSGTLQLSSQGSISSVSGFRTTSRTSSTQLMLPALGASSSTDPAALYTHPGGLAGDVNDSSSNQGGQNPSASDQKL